MSDSLRPYRVAVREDGEFVNAYFAKADTLDGAWLVASISKTVLELEPVAWQVFQEFMKCVASTLVEKATGARVVDVIVGPGPAHERSGSA